MKKTKIITFLLLLILISSILTFFIIPRKIKLPSANELSIIISSYEHGIIELDEKKTEELHSILKNVNIAWRGHRSDRWFANELVEIIIDGGQFHLTIAALPLGDSLNIMKPYALVKEYKLVNFSIINDDELLIFLNEYFSEAPN